MELRQIRYFVAVVEERSFSRAAERLRIAQSGISQQIKVLESSIGVRLFDRSAQPVALTPEGEVFLGHARLMLELATRAVEEVRVVADQHRSILKFGGSAFGHGPVADELLRVARTLLVDVDLQIHLDTTANNVVGLNKRVLDVVFAYVPFESDETPRYLRLGSIEMLLAVPASHRLASSSPIPREELLQEQLLLGPRSINPALAEHVFRSLFGRTDPPHLVELSDVGSARFQLVAQGLGITPVAIPIESLIPIPGVVYRRVEDPAPIIEYGLLWFDDHISPGLTAFLDLAREFARKAPEEIGGRLSGAEI
jgi:DNA-binding transcriptional LysR family regulator